MICLVHGIRSFDPLDTMGPLFSALVARGLVPRLANYGYILVPLTNGRAKQAILEVAKPGCTLVGYSNGGAAVHATAERVKARHIVLISSALPVDVDWPPCVKTVTVFYSPGDGAIEAGGVWATIANAMPWRWGSARDHAWGRMGLVGAKTDDRRVKNVKMPSHIAHSWFRNMGIVNWIADAIDRLQRVSDGRRTNIATGR